jgi:hypothetical protein
VNGGFRGTTAIHVFETVDKFSAEVVVGPSTSQRPYRFQVFQLATDEQFKRTTALTVK